MSMTTATIRQIRQHGPTPSTIGLKSFPVCAAPNMTTIGNARMKLEIEIKQLQRSWRDFQDSLRHHEQRSQTLASLDLVRESIEEAVQLWSTPKQQPLLQKSVKWAQTCLDTLDVHPRLMEFLPEPQRAYDLFFGVVYSVINASKEQYRVAGVFLKFLTKINKAVSSALVLASSELAASLYAQIFLFLGEFMRDYVAKSRCRILYSHNEDFKTNFKNLIDSVENFAAMKTDSVCSSPCVYTDTAGLVKVGLEGDARVQASQTTFIRQLIWNVQKKKAVNAKLAQGWRRIFDLFLSELKVRVRKVDADGAFCQLSGSSLVDQQNHQPESVDITTKRRLLKLRVQQDSSSLQDFFDNNEQTHPFGVDERLAIPAPVATEIYNWMRVNPSLPLAVEGSHSLGLPGRLTLISACYVSIARKHSIPTVSHFCAASPRASKEAGIISLVYSLIRQLIDVAPPMMDCDSNCDLGKERFCRLNGTMSSWTDALGILDALLRYKPPVLFCVIDALDVLEDESTVQYVKPLVDLLVSHTTRCSTAHSDVQQTGIPKDGLIKVLFTTAGQCQAIQNTFNQGRGLLITTDPTHVHVVNEDTMDIDA
ncbi:hypothetical protein BGW36DRAFT_89870 [Talaromyces proteolyticus]|uniref:Uncharacterized protein n=1 Tax=Talaromyces proteolyticus TaxID=1131652 RepID=A0AAD4L187_9EURO|nr:uncharacterized protein BGW36DRAFT_89870 [Talaromyces proteolyticus]KAH8703665.1 hypothetical protein BGW36DRAFT_89870 [Talaromyces proteolyticus]